MKKIKINKNQAKMLKEMLDAQPKVLKISEAQYQKILEMERDELMEDELAGVQMSKANVPSNKITKNFNLNLSKPVKKEIGKLYEEFLNEVYGLNENTGTKYQKLISLMETAGFITNGRIRKDKFHNDKSVVREMIGNALSEMDIGASEYKVMEMMETRLNEYGGYPAGAEFDSSAPYNEPNGEEVPGEEYTKANAYPLELVYYNNNNGGMTLFKKDGMLLGHINEHVDGEMMYDYCPDPSGADADCVNNFINDLFVNGQIKIGNTINDTLFAITPETKVEVLKYFGNDSELVALLNGMDETDATSSGAYTSSLNGSQPELSNEPNITDELEELEETTTTTSVGGDSGTFAYDAPPGDNNDFWTAGNKLNKRMNESQMGRYFVEMSFYAIGSTEEEARQEAEGIANDLRSRYDNQASITNFGRKDFGSPIGEEYSQKERDVRQRYLILLDMYKNGNHEDRKRLKPQLEKVAKKMGIKLDLSENAMKDTQWPKGAFVELDNCTKLNNNKEAQNGGCNQGDTGVVKTRKSTNSVISKESVYSEVAKRTGKTIDEVKKIISKGENL